MVRHNKISDLIFTVCAVFFLLVLSGSAFYHAAAENRKDGPRVLVTPGDSSIGAGKSRHFSLKSAESSVNVNKISKNGKWTVNGIEGGKKSLGKINKKGVYKAPKKNTGVEKVTIGFNGSSDSNVTVIPAIIKLKDNKPGNGRLNLRVKWKKNGSSKAQEKAPAEIKSVKGIATKEDDPDKGKEFSSNPAIVNLSESRELAFNVPIGSYTVFLQAFDEENGKGNVIYEGTRTGVEAVETGAGQPEPKPITIFLIEKDTTPSIDISPVTATVHISGTLQFSSLVGGVVTDTGNPVRWLICPDSYSKLNDFLESSEMIQSKYMKKWKKLYGSIDDNGLYSASGMSSKKFNVIGLLKSSVDDGVSGNIYDTALVTVIPQISVSVLPNSAYVSLGETKQFTAEVSNVISNSTVAWSVIGGNSNGTIDSSGLYTAPSEMPANSSVMVRATSEEDNSVYGEATVTLESPSYTISLVAPDIPNGSIYNLLAISTTTAVSEVTAAVAADTYEAVFIPQISEGWDPVTGTILNVKGNILIADIPDGLPFGECNVTLKNKLNSGSSNTLKITILPPFDQTLAVTGIGEDSGYYSSGICTDKLYDSNGDFYVSLGAYGDGSTTMGKIIKINPSGEQSLVTDNVGYVRGIDMDSNGDIFAGETYYDLDTTTYYDRLIRVPSGSDTPLRDFTSTDFLYDMYGVAVGPDGNIYATNDVSNESIYQYPPSGGEGTIYTTPGDETIGLAFNSEGYLFMAEDDDSRIFRAPPGGGESETFIDSSFYASSLEIDYQDNILIGTYGNYVVIYDRAGNNLGDWFKLNLDEIIGVKTDLNNNLYILDINNKAFRFTAPQLPDFKPTIGGFEIKDVYYDGNVYATIAINAYYIPCECTWTANIDGTEYELSQVADNTLQGTVPLSILLKSGKISVYIFSGDNSSNTINFPIPKEIFILPDKVFLNPGETNSFTAYYTGTDSGAVNWSVEGGAGLGSIDSTGLYTAPLSIPSVGKITVTATSVSEPSISGTAEVIMANIYGTVTDNQTQEPVEGAGVVISGTLYSLEPFTYTTNTDISGNYTAVVPPGEFSVEISKMDYQDYFDSAFIGSSTDSVQINVELSSDASTVPVGSVSGKVLTSVGEPIDGAVVTIDGGTQTNGVFAATSSGSDGFYEIKSIPINGTDGNPIAGFTVSAIKDGFDKYSSTGIQLITNTNTANVDLYLTVSSGETVYFSDDFETDKGWNVSNDVITDTVRWQRIQNPEVITNTAYPLYVTLPPDDISGGALPSPHSSEWCLWFGDPAYGNFMGTPSSLNTSKNGGTSEITHLGSITSSSTSLINIPSNAISPKLRFWAWWEVEGENPNGFDVMDIYILSSEVETQILSLNPLVDPVVQDRIDKPYTSAGFFRVPIWVPYEIDLSPSYIGQNIQIIFRFNTADESYNGFRGWLIDDVKVVDTGIE
ncbi:MAG: carboxypeptidase regulatory-like domain-containing protein [Candidatus Schekmanbacteria bacterium]|nr:carboxypeptidase regulatory-like domain-containing protein [Candidatus Schekmanbacteria bacterium]